MYKRDDFGRVFVVGSSKEGPWITTLISGAICCAHARAAGVSTALAGGTEGIRIGFVSVERGVRNTRSQSSASWPGFGYRANQPAGCDGIRFHLFCNFAAGYSFAVRRLSEIPRCRRLKGKPR